MNLNQATRKDVKEYLITPVIINSLRQQLDNRSPRVYHGQIDEYSNSYTHALGLRVTEGEEAKGCPGIISLIAKKSAKVYQENSTRNEEILKSVISDCEVLNISAETVPFEAPPQNAKSYKVLLCKEMTTGCWHFIRQSVRKNGEMVWTTTDGWNFVIEPVKLLNGIAYTRYSTYKVISVLELTPES